jgi:hypothetical protein
MQSNPIHPATLGGVGGQLQRTAVGDTGLVRLAQLAQQVGTDGVVEVIAVQRPGESLQFGHRGPRPGRIPQGDRPMQPGDRRRREVQQHVV